MRSTLATAGTLATAVVAATLTATPALADDPAPSRITVRPSVSEPDPGQQFLLRGRLRSEGEPVAGATVRVQTWRDGGWQRLKGAVVTTNDEGRYRVRVILFQDGDRDLRVVGNPAGDDIRTARATTVVARAVRMPSPAGLPTTRRSRSPSWNRITRTR